MYAYMIPYRHEAYGPFLEGRAGPEATNTVRKDGRPGSRTYSPGNRSLLNDEEERIEMKKRAVLYCRVSTADQHPETQLYDLRELAKQRGLDIVREYTDVISGT